MNIQLISVNDTIVSVTEYSFVTVVPPRLTHLFHGLCHTCSKLMERVWQPRWNDRDNSCCHSCACSLTIYVDFEGVAFAACCGGWPLAVGMDKDIALDQAFDYLDAVEQRDI